MPLGVRGNRTLRKWLERKKVLGMIKVTAEFEADSVDEMQGEVKAFLDALREYCDADVVVTTADEGEATEEIGIGYRYDDGEPINDALRKLCEERRVDDWRNINFNYWHAYEGVFVVTQLTNPAGEEYPSYERDDISYKIYRAGVKTLGDLVKCSEKQVSCIHLIGPKRIEIICERLDELGLSLATD